MTNKNIAIRVRELDKKFTLGRPQEKYHTLRDAIVNSVKAPFKRFHRAPPSEELLSAQGCCYEMIKKDMWGFTNLFFEALV